MRTVVVLADEDDAPVDAVVRRLGALGVPVFRADTSLFPAKLVLGARHDGVRWSGELHTEHRRVDLCEIGAIWYRTPTAFQFDGAMNPVERAFAHREARFGLGGVLAALPDTLWMNNPNRAADAMYKPLQLQVAAECGLRTPRTVVTNDPDAVRAFAAEAGHGVVVKTLGANTITEGGNLKVVFTHRLSTNDLADPRGIDLTAHQIQEWIPKSREMRVIAVGEKLFPVLIDTASDAAYVDWRIDYDSLTYELTVLPAEVDAGIRAYLRRFGLTYAAFDFAIDPQGRYWFFEANTSGQFGWLEAATGAPIIDTIASTLAEGART